MLWTNVVDIVRQAFAQDISYLIYGFMDGVGGGIVELHPGIFQFPTWPSSGMFRDLEHYPKFDDPGYRGSYGVCDSYEQVLAHYPELEGDPTRLFVVVMVEVRREDQAEEGGWRWHKWGEYIGTHDIQEEYLYNEVGIDRVFTYSIYEKVRT